MTNRRTHPFWRLASAWIACEPVSSWLIRRAQRTPYVHLEGYMDRWWLFNPYPHNENMRDARSWWRRMLPSVRIHHILRADSARHPHDHPWNARTIVLKGWYEERRKNGVWFEYHARYVGDTAALDFGEYHSIDKVSDDGVWTLFITWRHRGPWGFLVDGKKVIHTEYLE